MARSSIAVQLYTLREFTRTATDIATTLKRVREIGYSAVQLSALGPIDPKELKAILDGEGLTVAATHVSIERLTKELPAVVEEHQLWDCPLTAIGGFFPGKDCDKAALWDKFIADFSPLAEQSASLGLQLGYHNHSHELIRTDRGPRPFDLLFASLPASVWYEIDTYWITHGGGDPIDWIKKVAGKIPAIHLKDMRIDNESKQFMAEVGEGNLNFPGILKAAKDAGVKWFIVEQDICYRDPFDSLATSLKNLQELGMN